MIDDDPTTNQMELKIPRMADYSNQFANLWKILMFFFFKEVLEVTFEILYIIQERCHLSSVFCSGFSGFPNHSLQEQRLSFWLTSWETLADYSQ